MRVEFPDIYEELLAGSRELLEKELNYKLQVIREHELENAKKKKGALSSHIAYQFLGTVQHQMFVP